jgi:hypothetical protein
MNANFVLAYGTRVLGLSAAALLSGCAAGITGLQLDTTNRTVCDTTGTVCGIDADAITTFKVLGHGACGSIGMNWGDGDTETVNGNFAATTSKEFIYVNHTYDESARSSGRPLAWPGPKTVHAFSAANCTGEAKLRINVLSRNLNLSGQTVFSPSFRVGLAQPTTAACNTIPNTRPVRQGATITIEEISGSPTINFGCAFGGCINDMGGNAIATDRTFPFPALRRHSLIVRIVGASGATQIIQGQAQRFQFVAAETGPLELCVNDNVLSDNTGAWGIDISVNETTIP